LLCNYGQGGTQHVSDTPWFRIELDKALKHKSPRYVEAFNAFASAATARLTELAREERQHFAKRMKKEIELHQQIRLANFIMPCTAIVESELANLDDFNNARADVEQKRARLRAALRPGVSAFAALRRLLHMSAVIQQAITDNVTNEKMCITCANNNRNIRFEPCGHVLVCQTCMGALASAGQGAAACPVCRVAIKDSQLCFF